MIEVGEYIRTQKGEIGKIIKIKNDDEYSYDYYVCDNDSATSFKMQIVKHSPNLIDLIEVGDYVNGSKVVGKNGNLGELVLREDTGFLYINKGNNISKIKSIVTKEMFASMEYKVKE